MVTFCRSYQDSGSAELSAIAAGYSPHTAQDQGGRLLGNTRIRRELARLRTEALASRGIDRSYVITALVDIVEDREVAGQARVRAIELLGKDLGMFVEKSERRTHIVVQRATPSLNPSPLPLELSRARAAILAAAVPVDSTIVDDVQEKT
jgi:hypothetical protein